MSAAGRSSLSFVAGVAVGSLAGLIGLGGAEFRLPVLKAVFHCPVHRAVTLNLAMSFLTLAAALPVRLRVGLEGLWEGAPLIGAMVVGAAAGASAGAALARRLCAARLERLVLILLVGLGGLLIGEAFVAWESPGVGGGLLVQGPLALLLGAGIGVVSSLLGVAGGELIIPTLTLLFGFDVKVAGTASTVVSLPTIGAGLWRYAALGAFSDRDDLRRLALPMGTGSLLGAAAGGFLLPYVPAAGLEAGLGLLLIGSAFRAFGRREPARGAENPAGPPFP